MNPRYEDGEEHAPDQVMARVSSALTRLAGVHEPGVIASALTQTRQRVQTWWSGGGRRSRLTADGCPVELAFNDLDSGMRVNCEPGAGLDCAVANYRDINGQEVNEAVSKGWTTMQHGRLLRWGAWLGLAWPPVGGPRAKIYAEVPESNQAAAWRFLEPWLPEPPRLPARSIEPRMLAFSAQGQIELYARVTGLLPWELRCLLEPVGLGDQALALRDQLESLCEAACHRNLPCGRMGFSYALSPNRAASFTLYAFARNLLGSDISIRQRVLRCAARRQRPMEGYAEVSRVLTPACARDSLHGMVGVSIDRTAQTCLRVSLSPPRVANRA